MFIQDIDGQLWEPAFGFEKLRKQCISSQQLPVALRVANIESNGSADGMIQLDMCTVLYAGHRSEGFNHKVKISRKIDSYSHTRKVDSDKFSLHIAT